jgi:hypothetical protein
MVKMSENNKEILNTFVGKTITKIEGEKFDNFLFFTFDDESKYKFYHDQECCENVFLDDICGELEHLVGTPLLLAEEVSNAPGKNLKGCRTSDKKNENCNNCYIYLNDSYTWTFYKFATIKGYVDFKWYGGSNGYYSEEVLIKKIK